VKAEYLVRMGSISMERLGSARHSAEMHGMAQNLAEPREFGRKRLNLRQCPRCLHWGKLSEPACAACGAALGEDQR
jgi:hypothetical protein